MNIKQLRPGQSVLVQIYKTEIDGIPVVVSKQTEVRNHAKGDKVFVKGHYQPVKFKRITLL
ncbi:MAG: hypothetical protein AB7E04_12890 [Desulfobacteraceae bacterium]